MSFIPAPNCWSNCPNPQGMYYNSAVGGGCPPTHPNSRVPNCPPPQPVYGPNNYPDLDGITATFVNNMFNGYNNFGCSFLYNRHGALSNRLAGLQTAGTNPYWQQLLTNRIYYINLLISQHCIMM
jgi:hypothetical protein